jgi:hypothetical protein
VLGEALGTFSHGHPAALNPSTVDVV